MQAIIKIQCSSCSNRQCNEKDSCSILMLRKYFKNIKELIPTRGSNDAATKDKESASKLACKQFMFDFNSFAAQFYLNSLAKRLGLTSYLYIDPRVDTRGRSHLKEYAVGSSIPRVIGYVATISQRQLIEDAQQLNEEGLQLTRYAKLENKQYIALYEYPVLNDEDYDSKYLK